jgi:signal recognition particle subunit SRP54
MSIYKVLGKQLFRKISQLLKPKEQKSTLVACDIYRPAAQNQIACAEIKLCRSIFRTKKSSRYFSKKRFYRKNQTDSMYVIVDTAGRYVDEENDERNCNVHAAIKPQETLFVVDAMTGQDANTKAFNDRLNFDGVILTKLDGDTWWAAISLNR